MNKTYEILNFIDEACVELDRDYNILYLNTQAERLWQKKKEEDPPPPSLEVWTQLLFLMNFNRNIIGQQQPQDGSVKREGTEMEVGVLWFPRK